MTSYALERAREAKEAKGVIIHLYRGAPIVRSWSKYKETITEWTLCGISSSGHGELDNAVEDPEQVNCPFCKDLMRA